MCLDVNSKKLIANEDIVCYKRLSKTYNAIGLNHGDDFIGIVKGIECSGKISIDADGIYLCTNEFELDGSSANDMLGYLYSWYIHEQVEKLVVNNQVVQFSNYITPYQRFPVEIGKTYKSKLVLESYQECEVVNIGIHSFKSLDSCIWDGYGVYVKCIIPKGSKYYEGLFCGEVSYASNTLTYLEIVE